MVLVCIEDTQREYYIKPSLYGETIGVLHIDIYNHCYISDRENFIFDDFDLDCEINSDKFWKIINEKVLLLIDYYIERNNKIKLVFKKNNNDNLIYKY